MGVSKSMKIFTEAMQNGMSTSGYGSKIVNTPMGPFKWDDNLQVWVNVNNGFLMPNISIHEQYLHDYDVAVSSPGFKSGQLQQCTETISAVSNTSFILFNSGLKTSIIGTFSPPITCPQGVIIYVGNPNDVAIGDMEIKFEASTDGGNSFFELFPDIGDNENARVTILPGQQIGTDVQITVSSTVVDPTFFTQQQTGVFTINNLYDNSVIKTVTITTDNT